MGRLLSKERDTWVEYNTKSLYRKENGQWVQRDWSILDGRKYLYEWLPLVSGQIGYVSLGDSIAAGHTINENWDRDYGERSQYAYGDSGNKETALVPNCYTDLIYRDLVSVYGVNNVFFKSFARSGDMVYQLIDKLTHPTVREALTKADLVTVCIGANDVLQPAWLGLEDYIYTGSLVEIENAITSNLANLQNDSSPTSYRAMLNKLAEVNPTAKYLFTTVYNPYKYLYLKPGPDGFFKPLLDTIPKNWVLDIDEMIEDMFGLPDLSYWSLTDWKWVSIELDFDIGSTIKNGLLSVPIVQQLFQRVNNLSAWTETRVTQLNNIIKTEVNAYQATNPNFSVVDTKALFDQFPDKTSSSADVDYSDLVSVEFTSVDTTMTADWGQLYGGDPAGFWTNLAYKYLTFTNAVPSLNVADYVSFDLVGFATDLVRQIVEKVVIPDVDPHPEYRGHAVLKRSFTNAIGLVKYVPNGGGHVPGEIVGVGKSLAETKPTWVGCSFAGWYTDPALTQIQNLTRTDYVDHDESVTLAEMVDGSTVKAKTPKTTTLYAKWTANT